MPEEKFTGFPDLNDHVDFQATRPMSMHELPPEVTLEHELAIINAHHARIGNSIRMFWGHKDCVEYLQQLLLKGGDGVGRQRIGFKHEVVAALMNLIELHDAKNL
jgi:hypothetical protein